MLVKKGGDKVPEPSNSASADDPDDTDNDKHYVILFNALDDSVNSPYEVNTGKREDNLYDPRKVVDCFDEFFHFISPIKNN